MDQVIFSHFQSGKSCRWGTKEGTAVIWLLRGHWWCADLVGFPQGMPSSLLRGPMSKFLFTWHLRGLGWCVEPSAFSTCETQWPTQRPDEKDAQHSHCGTVRCVSASRKPQVVSLCLQETASGVSVSLGNHEQCLSPLPSNRVGDSETLLTLPDTRH